MKRLFDAGIIILATIFVLTVVGSYAHKLSKKEHHTGKEEFRGHDDFIEEACEEIHGIITGSKKDFTPESPEK